MSFSDCRITYRKIPEKSNITYFVYYYRQLIVVNLAAQKNANVVMLILDPAYAC